MEYNKLTVDGEVFDRYSFKRENEEKKKQKKK